MFPLYLLVACLCCYCCYCGVSVWVHQDTWKLLEHSNQTHLEKSLINLDVFLPISLWGVNASVKFCSLTFLFAVLYSWILLELYLFLSNITRFYLYSSEVKFQCTVEFAEYKYKNIPILIWEYGKYYLERRSPITNFLLHVHPMSIHISTERHLMLCCDLEQYHFLPLYYDALSHSS